jgi:glycine cleavage system pyridoxal-binding protein P
MGVDVVMVGTSQRFGVPMGFEVLMQHFFCSTKDEFKRHLPGRY